MSSLTIGQAAPEFTSTDQHGKTVSLKDFKGKKLILYFYPKDNTPGCTAEACDLRDNFTGLKKQGYAVVGVSADSAESHARFASKYELPFSLLADTDKKILKAYGAWGLKKNYGKEYEGIIRSTFVIDEDGTIEQIITKVKTAAHTAQIL